MSSLIGCPSCGRQLKVPSEFLGKSVRCPSCGEMFRAPEVVAAAAPPAAEAPPAPAPAEPSPIITVPLKLELDDEPPAARPAAEAPRKEEPRPPREEPPPRRRRRDPDDYDEDDDDRDDRRRGRRRRREFEPCPRCDEDVRRGAVVCPYCGLDLEIQGDGYTRQAPVRHDAEPHRGGVIQALGIASLVVGIFYFLFPISLPLGIAAWVMGRRDLRKMDDGLMDPNGRKKTRDGWLCGLIGTIMSCVFGVICTFAILMIVLEATRPRPPAGPAFANPPAWQNPQQQPQPGLGLNNITLRGPVGPVVVKPGGEKRPVTVTVERLGNFRGQVVVRIESDLEPFELDTDQGAVTVMDWQQAATFHVTARPDAEPGERVIHLAATTVAGDHVRLDVRVVVRGP